MFELFEDLLSILPPLRRTKRPNVAAFVGTLGGPILLSIYLVSFIDLIVGLIISGVLLLIGEGISSDALGGFALIAWGSWGLWGYLRVTSSNRQLAATASSVAPVQGSPAPRSTGPPSTTPAAPAWWASVAPPAPPAPGPAAAAPAPSNGWWSAPTPPTPPRSEGDWWTATTEERA